MEATRELVVLYSLSLIIEASKEAILPLQLSASSLEVNRGVKGIGFVGIREGINFVGIRG